MQIHPAAKIFPTLPAKEMKELKADIEKNGIKLPLLVNKQRDTIYDGRNRWMIAHDLGIKAKDIPMEEFEGDDDAIASEILSRNVFRRHLNDDQRTTAIAKLRLPALEKEAAERKAKKGTFGVANADGKKGSVAEHVAKEAKVSEHKAEQAIKAVKAGMADDVIANKTTLKKVAKTTKKPAKVKAAKVQTLEEKVWAKWDQLLKHFSPAQRRQVKDIVRGFLIEDKDKK